MFTTIGKYETNFPILVCTRDEMRMTASSKQGMFHLKSAEDFFYCINVTLQRYEHSQVKQIEDLMFLLMGLNHLREWIAPGYKYDKKIPPSTPEQKFFVKVHETPEFKAINELCNGTKHLNNAPPTHSNGGLNIDEWPDFDSVVSVNDGPPTGFYYNGEEVGELLRRLAEYYRNEWFSHNQERVAE